MRRRALTLVAVLALATISVGVFAATITVPEDYLTIQAALDAAQPGDTVYVKAGRYTENLVIDKPLSLVGEDRTTTIIRSLGPEQDVITVKLPKGNVEIASIKVSGGLRGIYVDVDAGTQATVNDVIVSENQLGMVAFGDGALVITASYFVDNDSVGLVLGITTVLMTTNEVMRGEMGVVLVGAVRATLDNNLIGLCQWGIDTYTQSCGWADGGEYFSGEVDGTGNRVCCLNTDLCPEQPGSPWPAGFVDEVWRETVSTIDAYYIQGVEAYNSREYHHALEAYSAGLAQFVRCSQSMD